MWDVTDASVVCRQLGLSTTGFIIIQLASPRSLSSPNFIGVEPFQQATFGQGTGRIWLDNVQCAGSERVLMNCTAGSSGNNSCTHAQDAGVRCPAGIYRYST